MHSAVHSQTLFEKELPRRPLARSKQGGFYSSKEIGVMRKQRLKNQHLVSRGNIYRY